jgi:hypothetical protein
MPKILKSEKRKVKAKIRNESVGHGVKTSMKIFVLPYV